MSWLIWKDPDAGKDWGQEEKGTTENEMVGCHHQLNGHGFGWTLGVDDGQGGLVHCDSWGSKELDTTEQLNCLTDWSTSLGCKCLAKASRSSAISCSQGLITCESQSDSSQASVHKTKRRGGFALFLIITQIRGDLKGLPYSLAMRNSQLSTSAKPVGRIILRMILTLLPIFVMTLTLHLAINGLNWAFATCLVLYFLPHRNQGVHLSWGIFWQLLYQYSEMLVAPLSSSS